MLKTVGVDDACVFLEENRCTIQDAKPGACRLYPFVVEPKSGGKYTYLLSMEKITILRAGRCRLGIG